ncbi:MAG: hypothetical protein Q9161_008345 [Pseudevernia consocians]
MTFLHDLQDGKVPRHSTSGSYVPRMRARFLSFPETRPHTAHQSVRQRDEFLRANAAALSKFNLVSTDSLTTQCACAIVGVRFEAVFLAVALDGYVV